VVDLRLAIFVPGALDAPTGGTRYDVRLAQALAETGADVAVVPLAGGFPIPDRESEASLADAIGSYGADRLIVLDGLCLATLVAIDSRIRFVALMHHPADRETGIPAGIARRLFQIETRGLTRAVRVVATSGETAKLLTLEYGVAPDRVGVVAPGVSVAVLARRRTAPVPSARRLLAVGSVTPRKGYDVLIDAIDRLRRGHSALPPCEIDCVGALDRDPTCVAQLSMRVSELGLGGCIAFRGAIGDAALARAYRDAHLFVHAAHYEGYGMAVADALACGVPVVAAAGGAVADLVPPDAGLLVPTGDAAALADALARVLSDRSLRARLAAGARRAGATLPCWPQAAAAFAAQCRIALA
jgi:glycosyltransferase involved in cell wall biosynthesis